MIPMMLGALLGQLGVVFVDERQFEPEQASGWGGADF
jgi:hypothetical protein